MLIFFFTIADELFNNAFLFMAIDYFSSPEVSEIVIALVGGIGIDHSKVASNISERLSKFNYTTHSIRISHDVLPKLVDADSVPVNKFERAGFLMDIGNKAREKHKEEGIAALGAIAEIHGLRKLENNGVQIRRTAYVIGSLKRPEEVAHLRQVYQGGFYLVGVHSSEKHRQELLQNTGKGMTAIQAKELITRDQAEQGSKYGQETRKTFTLSDFFIEEDGNDNSLRSQIHRIIDLIFGHPYITPTFDEYAMFLAVASSLHSADLSRQVGAVIARNEEVLSTGSNDCPRAGGGLYWPEYCSSSKAYTDREGGRDHTLKCDTNFKEREKIFQSIANNFKGKQRQQVLEALSNSPLTSLTEFGRMVHAEMEALLNCARNAISSRDASLYTTTFPCHNCAKHIVAGGLKEVIYVEPYPKSKALQFYKDSITEDASDETRVRIRPFIGVGARQFLNLFSMELGNGRSIKRKNDKDGNILVFDYATAETRIPLRCFSYVETELSIFDVISKITTPPPCKQTHVPPTKMEAPQKRSSSRSATKKPGIRCL